MSDLDKDINPFEDPEFASFMLSMKALTEDKMMELSYDLLIKNAESAVMHEAPLSSKLSAINKVINFFEHREEYEKCAKLHALMTRIDKKK